MVNLKKNTNNDKPNLKDLVDEIISVNLIEKGNFTLLVTLIFIVIITLGVLYNVCFFVPSFRDFMKETFAPLINIILYLWHLYCKFWESFGFDTTSKKFRDIITWGVAIFLALLLGFFFSICEMLIDEKKLDKNELAYYLSKTTYSSSKGAAKIICTYKHDIKFRRLYNIILAIISILETICISFIVVSSNIY